MRKLINFILFAATGLACTALAEPTAAPDQSGAATTVSVIGVRPYRMLPGRLDQTLGAWHLDNGVTLRISAEHHQLIGEIGRMRAELVPVADNVFFAKGENLTVVLGQGSSGEDMYMTYEPEKSELVPRDALERIAALR